MKPMIGFLFAWLGIFSASESPAPFPLPPPSIDLRWLEVNSVRSLPISALHPSQGKIGRADVFRRVDKMIEQLDGSPIEDVPHLLAEYQSQLDYVEFPCTVMPDGACWVSDGHHRTSTFAWIEFFQEVHGTFKIPVRIEENYSELSWVDAVTRLIETNRIYLRPEVRSRFDELMVAPMSEEARHLELQKLIESEIPRDFKQISDDPLRAAVGEVLDQLLRGIPTINFVEFYVGEMVRKAYFLDQSAGLNKWIKQCPTELVEHDCVQLKPKRFRKVSQLILYDPTMIHRMIESIREACRASIHNGDESLYLKLFLKRLRLARQNLVR